MFRKRYVLFVSVLLLTFIAFANAEIFEDRFAADFVNGTFYRTFYNSSGFIQLNISQGFTSGNFSSRVFDAGFNATWNNISWLTDLCYGCELPANGIVEQGHFLSPANMSGNVLLLHMDESSGSIIDYSGYSNNGTPVFFEGNEYGAEGKFNTSLDFERTGGVGPGEYINLSSPTHLSNFGNELTLEAWINPESFTGSPTIIDKDPSVFSMYFVTSPNRVRVDLGTTNSGSSVTGSSTYSAGTWYHVVFTYDGNAATLYRNGAVDGTPVRRTGNVLTNNKALVMGSGWSGTNPNAFPFDGLIDEVAVYNRSLSAEEIRQHYLRGSLRLNISVRSCENSSCAGENYSQVNMQSPADLNLMSNRYFQYKSEFLTEGNSYTPKLYNLSIDYDATNSLPLINITYPVNNSNFSFALTSINYTVVDTDLDSCWYSTDLGQTNTTIICGQNITGLTSNQGNNIWKVHANDSTGAEGIDYVSFFVDSLPPNINVVSPPNGTLLTNTTIRVNYTVTDSGVGIGSCWWTNSSGLINNSISCGNNFSFIGKEGNNYVKVYANDSFGNINSTTHTLTVNTAAPSVTILSPLSGSVIGTTTNISLNYSVVDSNLQACWYSIDEITPNITLSGCQNITFDLPGQGLFKLNLYSNDTTGNLGYSHSTFTVSVGGPAINPLSPSNEYFGAGASQNITFTYIPIDLDLQTCSLWTNTTGNFAINQTDYVVESAEQNSFSLNLSNVQENAYSWAVACNDTLGHESITINKTFYVDRTVPNVTVNGPTGVYTSLLNIPVSLDYTDASPVQCIYNVTRSTGNLEIPNSELIDCQPTTFSLDIQTSYFLWMMVNDSAGNFNVSKKIFSVSVPSGGSGGSSGGGSSGGGGSSFGFSSFNLELSSLKELRINRGQTELIQLDAINSGLKFLNDCYFSASGGISEWISGQDIYSLGPGQTVNYIFNVNIPIDAEVGDYFVTLSVSCKELNTSQTYQIEVIGGEFELSILQSERIGTRLKVNYAVENFADKDKNLEVKYKFINSDNEVVVEGSFDSLEILPRERMEYEDEFELPKNSIGDYILIMEVTDGLDTSSKQQATRLTTGGISGFAISDNNLRTIAWFGIVLLLSFGIFIVIKFIMSHLAIRRANQDLDRQFINLDLH